MIAIMKKLTFILFILSFSITIGSNAQKGFVKEADSSISKINHSINKQAKEPITQTNLKKRKVIRKRSTISEEDLLYVILLSYLNKYYSSSRKISSKKN